VNDYRPVYPGYADAGEIEILHEEVAWANGVARVLNDRVRFPARKDGGHVEGDQFRLDHAPDKDHGVVIAPILEDGHSLLLVHQFRHPVRIWTREFPRGARERGESPEEAAARELKEELGCDAIRTFPLGRVTSDSGQQTGVPFLLAAIVREAGARQQEATEAISGTCRYTFSALHEACVRGDIVDSFTVCAVLRLTPWFTGDRLEPPE